MTNTLHGPVCRACTGDQNDWAARYWPTPPIKLVQCGTDRGNIPWSERVADTVRGQQTVIANLCRAGTHAD